MWLETLALDKQFSCCEFLGWWFIPVFSIHYLLGICISKHIHTSIDNYDWIRCTVAAAYKWTQILMLIKMITHRIATKPFQSHAKYPRQMKTKRMTTQRRSACVWVRGYICVNDVIAFRHVFSQSLETRVKFIHLRIKQHRFFLI